MPRGAEPPTIRSQRTSAESLRFSGGLNSLQPPQRRVLDSYSSRSSRSSYSSRGRRRSSYSSRSRSYDSRSRSYSSRSRSSDYSRGRDRSRGVGGGGGNAFVDVEAQNGNKVDSNKEGEEEADATPWYSKLGLWHYAAIGSAGINIFALIFSKFNVVVAVMTGVAVFVSAVVFKFQNDLTNIDTLRESQNELRGYVNDFAIQNQVLSGNNDKLEASLAPLKDTQQKLAKIAERNGSDVARLTALVKRNQLYIDEQAELVMTDILQQMMNVLLDADRDEDGVFTDKEVKRLIVRLNGLPTIQVNKKLFLKKLDETRSVNAIFAVMRTIQDPSIPTKERIFTIVDADDGEMDEGMRRALKNATARQEKADVRRERSIKWQQTKNLVQSSRYGLSYRGNVGGNNNNKYNRPSNASSNDSYHRGRRPSRSPSYSSRSRSRSYSSRGRSRSYSRGRSRSYSSDRSQSRDRSRSVDMEPPKPKQQPKKVPATTKTKKKKGASGGGGGGITSSPKPAKSTATTKMKKVASPAKSDGSTPSKTKKSKASPTKSESSTPSKTKKKAGGSKKKTTTTSTTTSSLSPKGKKNSKAAKVQQETRFDPVTTKEAVEDPVLPLALPKSMPNSAASSVFILPESDDDSDSTESHSTVGSE